jgi:hypothetical protein
VVSPVVYVALYAVTRVTNLVPFPRKVINDHLPRPIGSSPLATKREVQESHRIVAVPPVETGRENLQGNVRQMTWCDARSGVKRSEKW